VAHNLVVDHYRRSPPEEPVPIDSIQISQPDKSGEEVLKQEEAVYVRQALKKLTTLQQQVIVLKFLEGMNNEEVSEIMGKTVGSVKALQHRAVASLRRILEKENVQN
jgi:RNA polymerase sigma-70 factor (ECF subfamily)